MPVTHFVRAAIAATTVSLLVGLAAAPAVSADPGRFVRWVDDDGRADSANGCAGTGMAFEEIQLAVDDSDDNDVVNVCPGTYREQVSIAGKPGLVLRAVKPWTATIKPPVPGTSATGPAGFLPAAITISSDGASVRWMNIVIPATGDCDYRMNGIIVHDATDVSLRSNHISGGAGDPAVCGLADPIIFTNDSTGIAGFNLLTRFNDTGIFVSGSGSNVSVYQNSLRMFAQSQNCTASTPTVSCTSGASPAGGIAVRGIAVFDGGTARIRRNVIKEVPSTGTTSIEMIGILVVAANARISRNRIRGLSLGMELSGVDSGTVRLNRVSGGGDVGILLQNATGVLVANNRVFGRGGYGMFADSETSDNLIQLNDFSGNGATDCVDSSGPANTWTDDIGDESSPSGLCNPAP